MMMTMGHVELLTFFPWSVTPFPARRSASRTVQAATLEAEVCLAMAPVEAAGSEAEALVAAAPLAGEVAVAA
jgi:hypothetical protein